MSKDSLTLSCLKVNPLHKTYKLKELKKLDKKTKVGERVYLKQ